MLMGAAHNALWAFNARVSLTLPVCHRPQAATLVLRSGAVRSPVTVVPSCGLETRSWRTGRKKRKLFAGQNNLVPALIYMKSINIHIQLFISKQGWILIFRSSTAKNSRNLAQQDFGRKGLWNVIVNLLFKTPQLVFFIRKRSKHDNIGSYIRTVYHMVSHTPKRKAGGSNPFWDAR